MANPRPFDVESVAGSGCGCSDGFWVRDSGIGSLPVRRFRRVLDGVAVVGGKVGVVGGGVRAEIDGSAPSAEAGKRTVKRVPTPGSLSTRIPPPWPRMIPNTAESPSPRPANFVEKNGSNNFARVASSIPHPVSDTINSMNLPGADGLYTPPL